MSVLAAVDWTKLGGAITAIGIGVGGVWAWWLNQKRQRADVRADVAKSDSDRVIAEANTTVYELLLDRVKALEGEMRQVRNELAAERLYSRALVLHSWTLEGILRAAGLTVPVFDGTASPTSAQR